MSEHRPRAHGRDKKLESDDPHELVAHRVPGSRELMATCLVEEYARMGMSAEEIFALFEQPIYYTHRLYREWGERKIRRLIADVMARTGRIRVSVTFSRESGD